MSEARGEPPMPLLPDKDENPFRERVLLGNPLKNVTTMSASTRHPKQQGLRLYHSVMQSMPLHSRIHPPYQNLQAGALEQGNLPLIAAQTSVQANVTFWPRGKRLRPTRRGPSVSPGQGSCMPLAASPLRAALDGRLVPGPCCPASGPGVGGRY